MKWREALERNKFVLGKRYLSPPTLSFLLCKLTSAMMNPFLSQDQSPRLKKKLLMTLLSPLPRPPHLQPHTLGQLSSGSDKDPRLQDSWQGGWRHSEFPHTQTGNRDAWPQPISPSHTQNSGLKGRRKGRSLFRLTARATCVPKPNTGQTGSSYLGFWAARFPKLSLQTTASDTGSFKSRRHVICNRLRAPGSTSQTSDPGDAGFPGRCFGERERAYARRAQPCPATRGLLPAPAQRPGRRDLGCRIEIPKKSLSREDPRKTQARRRFCLEKVEKSH